MELKVYIEFKYLNFSLFVVVGNLNLFIFKFLSNFAEDVFFAVFFFCSCVRGRGGEEGGRKRETGREKIYRLILQCYR